VHQVGDQLRLNRIVGILTWSGGETDWNIRLELDNPTMMSLPLH
jgi:hypothetical protein